MQHVSRVKFNLTEFITRIIKRQRKYWNWDDCLYFKIHVTIRYFKITKLITNMQWAAFIRDYKFLFSDCVRILICYKIKEFNILNHCRQSTLLVCTAMAFVARALNLAVVLSYFMFMFRWMQCSITFLDHNFYSLRFLTYTHFNLAGIYIHFPIKA